MSWLCWRGVRRGGDDMSTTAEWDGGWYEITPESERRELDAELRREACPDHPLHGTEPSAVEGVATVGTTCSFGLLTVATPKSI